MKNLLTICCLVATAITCSARTVRTIFLQPPSGAPQKAVLFTGKKSIIVDLPGRNLSPEVKLPEGDLALTVLKRTPADPKAISPQAQRISIPKDWKRCILLFLPDPKNKQFPAKVIAINASQANFPLGNTMIYNVSPTVISAKLGKLRAVVQPNKRGMVKAPINKFGSYPVAIDCRLKGEEVPRAVCRTNWQHDPKARQILFVVPSPGYKTPRIWGVLDRGVEPKKEDE